MKILNMSKAILWIFFTLAAIPFMSFAQSDGDYRSKGSGNWSAISTWEIYSGGIWIDASVKPTNANGVITIRDTHTVTVDSTVTVDQLLIETGATLTTNAVTLIVLGSNNIINGSLVIANVGTIDVDGGVLNVNNGSVTLTNGSMATTSADPVLITDGTSTLSFPAIGGFNGITLINSGTTTLTSPTATGNIDGLIYVANNAGGDPAATLSIASGKNFTFLHDVIVRPQGTISGPGTITFSGISGAFGFVNNGSVTADVKFQRAGAGHVVFMSTTGTPTWQNVEIDDVDSVFVDLQYGGAPVINGTLTLTNGAFDLGTYTVSLGNSATIVRSGGVLSKALTFGTAVNVSYTGTTAVTTSYELPASTSVLNNLTINNSGGVTLNADRTVNGTLTLSSGALTLGSNTLTVASGGSTSGGSSTSYIVTDGTGALVQNVPGNDTNIRFPIGTSTITNFVILNNNGGTTDNYSVRVANTTSNVVDATNVVGVQWIINEAIDGESNIRLTLAWDPSEEGSAFSGSRTSALIGRYMGSGTSWSLLGTYVAGLDTCVAFTTSALSGTGIFKNSVYGVGLSGALPVELTSFTASVEGLDALLRWSTVTEVNNHGFEVERRAITTQNWKVIAFIAGAGTSNTPKEYTYRDQKLTPGVYVYRIKQIDNDGTYKYSASAQANAQSTPGRFELLGNYPNPFNPETVIQYSLPEAANVRLAVFDMLGREVKELVNARQGAGYYEVSFSGLNVSSGTYFYRISMQTQNNGSYSQIKKMILLK